MKITYKGNQADLMEPQRKKLDGKFAKISKLVDRRGEREAHVILTNERHLNHAEITVQYYDHALVGVGSDADLFSALSAAIDKLEKQILKTQQKWRDSKREAREDWEEEAPDPEVRAVAAVESEDGSSGKRVFRVNHHMNRKPMTLEEALLDMEKGADYLVYRDSETDRVAVLFRRRDGHYDLVEC